MEEFITGTNSSGNKCKVLKEMLDYYLERGFVPDQKENKVDTKIKDNTLKSGDEPKKDSR